MFVLLPAQKDAGIDVGALIVKAMGEAELNHASMWIDQGYPNASQWSKALRGEAPLDLWRLRLVCSSRAAMVFWAVFLSKFASALIAASVQHAFGPYRMAKAEIDTHEDERKRA